MLDITLTIFGKTVLGQSQKRKDAVKMAALIVLANKNDQDFPEEEIRPYLTAWAENWRSIK